MSGDTVRVQADDFDLGVEIAALTAGRTDIGAVVSFIGLVRDRGAAGTLHRLELEHYPGMTERALARLVDQARARWPLQAVRVIHRIGALAPGAQIVLVLTASPHRGAAFAAAEFLMDHLKTDAPFWKRESGPEGGTWVDARDTDTAARDRWR